MTSGALRSIPSQNRVMLRKDAGTPPAAPDLKPTPSFAAGNKAGPASLATVLFLLLLLGVITASAAELGTDPVDAYLGQRQAMVTLQLAGRGIKSAEVLRAMARVPRHLFVDERLRGRAYGDFPLPIGHGQTISQPYIVAYMTEIIDPQPRQKVLEIGTGSGYQAAVLSELVAAVYTMEIVPELARSAAHRLRTLGYEKIETRQGDGYNGWPEAAPFDAIVVTAAAEFIPPPLIRQLKEGGKMIIPVGSPLYLQHLMLVEKKQGGVTTRRLMPVRFVPFRREN